MVAIVTCPSCGEPTELALDEGDEGQEYVEDCDVCCRPMQVRIGVDDDGQTLAIVERLDA